jgi:hypothetical protein
MDENYDLCRQLMRAVLTGNIRAEERAVLAQAQAKNKSGCDRACPATETVLRLADKIPPALMAHAMTARHHPATDSLGVLIMAIIRKALTEKSDGDSTGSREL